MLFPSRGCSSVCVVVRLFNVDEIRFDYMHCTTRDGIKKGYLRSYSAENQGQGRTGQTRKEGEGR